MRCVLLAWAFGPGGGQRLGHRRRDVLVTADGGAVDFNRLNLVPFKFDISRTEIVAGEGRLKGAEVPERCSPPTKT